MEITRLEHCILTRMLADGALKPTKPTVEVGGVRVASRALTGKGFITELIPSEELKLFDDGVSLRWGKVGARLNATRLETGYLVYIDNGFVTAIEGYTYGDDWPAEIKEIEPYEL